MQRPGENATARGIVLPLRGFPSSVAGKFDPCMQQRLGPLGSGQRRFHQFGR